MLTLGAAMGGHVAAIFGARIALVVDSLSFVASAALVFWIAQPPRRAQHSVRTNGWTDFVAGLGDVRQNPRVGLVALVKAMGQIGSVDIMAAESSPGPSRLRSGSPARRWIVLPSTLMLSPSRLPLAASPRLRYGW